MNTTLEGLKAVEKEHFNLGRASVCDEQLAHGCYKTETHNSQRSNSFKLISVHPKGSALH